MERCLALLQGRQTGWWRHLLMLLPLTLLLLESGLLRSGCSSCCLPCCCLVHLHKCNTK
jgi:hypothetical protein